MPRFSIIVPAYNSAEYLPRCYASISGQSFADWEMVVVVDGSPDDSDKVARGIAHKDDRVHVVTKVNNGGIHRARMTGVERATGDFVFFLDADDELHEGCLARIAEVVEREDPDILHLGINVIGVDIDESERAAFESFINRDVEPLKGSQICAAAYDEREGYRQDWRLTQRLYRSELIKQAFSLMTHDRLGRNEDGYEYFVASCLAQTQVTRNDIVTLDYYYGRGLNGAGSLSTERFVATAQEFEDCLRAIGEFAASFDGFVTSHAVLGARHKATELLFNDWDNRVEAADKLAAAKACAPILGNEAVAAELARLARDHAYALLTSGGTLDAHSEMPGWLRAANELCGEPAEERTRSFMAEATSHLGDLELRSAPVDVPAEAIYPAKSAEWARQKVRIFVTTHKDVNLFDSDILQPMQVGFARPRKRFFWALQDDSGNNISELNAMFCELTTQYWAWKNADADYLGFCHYRRYFDFSGDEHEENAYGEVMDGAIDWDSQRRYALDDASIAAAVEGYDVITTGVKDLRSFPERYESPLDHYARAPYLHLEDLRRVMDILCEMHPDYAEDASAFLSGHESCFCNMFVMRRELFSRYCGWLFPVLERFVRDWDTTHLSREALRTPGHLSERLLNVFLIHEKRVNPELRHKEVQCVHFERPERLATGGLDAVDGGGLPVVPVVLAADNNYVPMLTTTIFSMLKNASPQSFYDVVVLEKDISARNKALMREFLARFSNASVRFVDVGPIIESFDLKTSNEHISVETYYRFLIQQVLPSYDKVLYLDSDLIVRGDVSELFASDLGDNLIGAVTDIDYLGNLNMNDGVRMAYTNEVLDLADPYGYFQAGVLVLNTAGLRRLHTVREWLGIAAEPKYIYDDQDILNAHCQGRVTYLDPAWNVMNDCGGRIAKVFSFAPAKVFDAFQASYANPKIVHYAGCEKPWKPGPCDLRELYWSYARETPFYEQLLVLAATGSAGPAGPVLHERAVAENSPVRGVLDPLMPLGSRRREVAKAIGRGLRGRK